jgi:uncharacterized protein YcfL
MKNSIILFFLGILLVSCGSSKKIVISDPQKNKDVTEVPSEEIEIESIPEISEKVEPEKKEEEEVEETISDIQTPEVVFNHQSFDVLLKKHVSEKGEVNYKEFKKDKALLRDYIALLGSKMPSEDWANEDTLAYWMNAYNAMTIDLILQNYPLKSIKDINNPWDQRLWKLGDRWYNLDEIEHQILRKMNDPRIHFGINCASFSCPPLLNEAFTSENVTSQLNALARSFVNDSQRNSIRANTIEISKLFSWFAKDFKKNGTLIDFLNLYSEIPIDGNARILYKDYNWDLNEQN